MTKYKAMSETGWSDTLLEAYFEAREPEEPEESEVEYDDDDCLRLCETGKKLVKFNRGSETWTFFDVDGKPFEIDTEHAMLMAKWLVEND